MDYGSTLSHIINSQLPTVMFVLAVVWFFVGFFWWAWHISGIVTSTLTFFQKTYKIVSLFCVYIFIDAILLEGLDFYQWIIHH
jgi:hypothetical protein